MDELLYHMEKGRADLLTFEAVKSRLGGREI